MQEIDRWKRGQESIVRSTLRAIWLFVPDPFSQGRQWPFIGSLVDYYEDRRTGVTMPEMPRNIALPFVMGSKNEIPPLAGLYGAMLGMRYDPIYTDFLTDRKNHHVQPAAAANGVFAADFRPNVRGTGFCPRPDLNGSKLSLER